MARGIGDASFNSVEVYAAQNQLTIMEALRRVRRAPAVVGQARRKEQGSESRPESHFPSVARLTSS